MSLPILRTPEYWRDRAEEARAIAENMSDEDARRSMLNIADNYEKIAKRAEAEIAAKQRETPRNA